MEISSAEREQQRFNHLALARPRPAPAQLVKPQGLSRLEWKVEKQRLREKGDSLAPGIEEQVQLRERWSHKAEGTPQTHEHFARRQEGALRRLYMSGAINAEQLASAVEISDVVERIHADVNVRAANLEPGVDRSRYGDDTFYEKLGHVRREVAYTRWRGRVNGPIAAVLDMIVGDAEGFTVVAKRYRMHNRKAKRILIDALDLWPQIVGGACKEIDAASLAAAQAGILG